MPKAKRTPIDYTPQFGAGIFRSKETIEQELAELADEVATDASDTANEIPPEEGVEVTADSVEGGDGKVSRQLPQSSRSNGATNARSNERTLERSRVRHSFDIWQDQLLRLSEIQADRFSRTGRKPKLGELVQEALDAYIAKEWKRTNVRTNER